MGMDVYGKLPVSEKGEYFRNNVWWWRPLAQYVVEAAPSITSKCTYWQSNDADGLEAEDSRKLAQFLREEIANGNCDKWRLNREKRLADLPLKACPYCNGTGTRTDAVGRANEMDKRRWCNGCHGTGTKQHEDTYYQFSTENVAEFVEFLENCGGFEIR